MTKNCHAPVWNGSAERILNPYNRSLCQNKDQFTLYLTVNINFNKADIFDIKKLKLNRSLIHLCLN